jgi:hypothetical protein
MPPGRYQSKLFQFFQQQTRRLSDRLSRGMREFQVAASWSVEAMLYPIFQILQKIEKSSGKQLNSKTSSQQSSQPLLPQADNGINKTVSTAKALVLQEKSLNKLRFKLAKIRGIATELSTRNLVLINNKNEVLDILSPSQQKMLQDLIVSQITEFTQLVKQDPKDLSQQLSQTQQAREIQPEIDRILAKLTGESRENISGNISENIPENIPENLSPNLPVIAALSPQIDSQEIEPRFILNPYKAISLIDSTLAKIEIKALPTVFKAAQLTQENSVKIIQIAKNKFKIFVYGKDSVISSENSNETQKISINNALGNEQSKTQSLIEAAINYFFGNSAGKQILQSSSRNTNQKKLPEAPRLKRLPQSQGNTRQNSDEETNPWLSVSDLFGEIEIISNNLPINSSNPALPAAAKIKTGKDLLPSYEEFLQPTKSNSSLVKSKKAKSDITPTKKVKNKDNKQDLSYQKEEIISYQESEEYIETKSDFIETKVSKVEYEKHPLELLLEWLDSMMLELEELFVKAFRWLRKFWNSKR